MRCRDMIGRMICSLLLTLPMAGCDYGDRNKDPIAENETAITAREVPVTINVLANDSDPDGDPLEVVGVTQGANGEVAVNDDGTVTYTPVAGFDGSDSFTYTIDDDHGGQATGSVTVTVLPNPGVVVNGTLYTVLQFIPEGVVEAAAWGINDTGQIAGSSRFADGSERPTFIDVDGSLTVIDVPSTVGRAFGINNSGTISGFFFEVAEAAEEQFIGQSFVWDSASRTLVAFYAIPNAVSTAGLKINDAGVIVGQVQLTASGPTQNDTQEEPEGGEPEGEGATLGFIRAPNGAITTFTVPGAFNTFLGGINNPGQIVGGFTIGTGEDALLFGFLRNIDGTFSAFNVSDENGTPLGTLANDINDAGVIVGHFMAEEIVLPFLRKPDGTIQRFDIPGAIQARFSDINNRDVISGFAIGEEGLFQALVLTPLEPAPNTFFEDEDME